MIAIVTDSTAYLSAAEAQALGVTIAPMTYTVDGRQFNEIYAGQNGKYEELLGQARDLRTSQTTMTVFMSAFEELLAKGYDILCITISSRLSGTYSSASIAARNLGPTRIRVVDSLSTAGGLASMVRTGAKMAAQGMEMDDIMDALRRVRLKTGVVFSVSDMGPLRRSGRLGVVRQSVGTILNIKPVLGLVEGSVVSLGTARGRVDMMRSVARHIPASAARLTVHHIADEKTAGLLTAELEKAFPGAEITRRPLGPVLGIHLGLGTVGVVWEGE